MHDVGESDNEVLLGYTKGPAYDPWAIAEYDAAFWGPLLRTCQQAASDSAARRE